jgi:hypothetical protein
MAFNVCYVKNISGSTKTYLGQEITSGSYYQIQDVERIAWSTDDGLLADITSDAAQISSSNSDDDLITAYSDQISYLKNEAQNQKDSEGANINRTKSTKTGWHYQPHWLEINTSKHGSSGFYNKGADGSDLGFVTSKIYDSNDDEITDSANEGDAVKTVLTWEPDHDYEIIASKVFQASAPSTDVRLWVEGVPDLTYAQGGSRMFAEGGINLKLLGVGAAADTDGRSSKMMTYNATYHTNKFEITVKYAQGTAHTFAMLWEIYKA